MQCGARNRYREAGADCLFVPGVRDAGDASARWPSKSTGQSTSSRGPTSPPVSELERLGVARVSVGSWPDCAAFALARNIAQELLGAGTYTFTAGAISYPGGQRDDETARARATFVKGCECVLRWLENQFGRRADGRAAKRHSSSSCRARSTRQASLEMFRRSGDDLLNRWDGTTSLRTLEIGGRAVAVATAFAGIGESSCASRHG